MCLVIASMIIIYLNINATDPMLIAKNCLQWALENDCICGITS